jgi:prepilin-type N-terminal cleavage/methylation domain-containing protein
MVRTPIRGEVRSGFTLIELLVVMAIIVVLVGLTSAAAMRLFVKGPELQAKADINQLSMAISAFKQEFGVKTMPSRIILHENMSEYNLADPIEAESRAFLGMMFGRRLQAQIDWNGDGAIQTGPAGRFDLSGEQCLVFFLGGAQLHGAQNSCLGFSTSPTNPMQPGGTRRGPFFDFKANRLVPDGANQFFVYWDPFARPSPPRQPFVYLADHGTNQYRPDSTRVAPYRSNAATFVNQGGFQIICAGLDGFFGNPATWSPTTGNTDPNGKDDFSNFSSKRLGEPQE